LNVLRGNIPLSACSKRKLILRKEADKSVSLAPQAEGYKSARRFLSSTAVCYYPLSPNFYFTRVNYVT